MSPEIHKITTMEFEGYPQPIEGPDTGCAPLEAKNPVLRGYPLKIASELMVRSNMLTSLLFKSTGMGDVKDMPILDDMPRRHSPLVIPLGDTTPVKLDAGLDLAKPKFPASSGTYLSAADYHALYRAGTMTPLQVAETLLPLIRKGQSPRSLYDDAWVDTRNREDAILEAARASTARYAAKQSLSVLDGVFIGVKDSNKVDGFYSLHGLSFDPSQPYCQREEESEWPVRKLQEAGAIVVGKNQMHELGMDTSGCNPRQGTPTNHSNPAYFTGGSSSGGASALGAGIVPISVGTDAGGSSRIPPSFCGVYGLKPTWQRTIVRPETTCATCPMAGTVADLTLAYRVMAQPDPGCPTQGRFAASKLPCANPSASGAGAPSSPPRVLGIYRDWWAQADPRVVAACDAAVAHLASRHGYDVVDVSIPHIAAARAAHTVLCVAECAELSRRMTADPGNWLKYLSPANKMLFALGGMVTPGDFLKAEALRELLMRHLAFLFRRHPGLLIVTPTSPLVGWARTPGDEVYGISDTNTTLANMAYVFLANLTGAPAVSAPVGYVDPEQGEGRLPVGLMATGDWGSEEQLLGWAGELEEYLHGTYEGGRVRPKTWVDVAELTRKANA